MRIGKEVSFTERARLGSDTVQAPPSARGNHRGFTARPQQGYATNNAVLNHNLRWLEDAQGPFCHMLAAELMSVGAKLMGEYKAVEARWRQRVYDLEMRGGDMPMSFSASDVRMRASESGPHTLSGDSISSGHLTSRSVSLDGISRQHSPMAAKQDEVSFQRAASRSFTAFSAKCYSMAAAAGTPATQGFLRGLPPAVGGASNPPPLLPQPSELPSTLASPQPSEPVQTAEPSLEQVLESQELRTPEEGTTAPAEDMRSDSSHPLSVVPRPRRSHPAASLASASRVKSKSTQGADMESVCSFPNPSVLDGDAAKFVLWSAWERCASSKTSYAQSRLLSRGITRKAMKSLRGRDSIEDLVEDGLLSVGDDLSDSDSDDSGIPTIPSARRWRCQWYKMVLPPSSPVRILWDILTVLFVVYESFAIPLQFLDLGTVAGLLVMSWMTRIFWTLDLPMQFFTSQMRVDGSFERRHWIVKRKYLTSWFALDAAVAIVDWLDVITERADELVVLRMLKLARLIRIMRLVRIMKVHKTPNYVKSVLQILGGPEFVVVVLSLLKLVLFIVWLNHMNACMWYSLAAHSHNDNNWLDVYNYRMESTSFKYFCAYHWSLSGFTGTMEVTPVNLRERLYSVLAVLASFFLAASLISTLTSAFTRLQIVAAKKTEMMAELRQYLVDNGISKELVLRVQRNAEMAMEAQASNQEVALLKVMSQRVLVELNFEIFLPMVQRHPFLGNYALEHKGLMKQICHVALSKMHMCKGDVLFLLGESCAVGQMYIIMNGKLLYHHHTLPTSRLKQGDWCVEAVLWTPWVHCGTMRVVTDCTLCVVSAEQFQQVASHSIIEGHPAWAYASRFVAALNETPEASLTDLSQDDMDLQRLADAACPVRRGLQGRRS